MTTTRYFSLTILNPKNAREGERCTVHRMIRGDGRMLLDRFDPSTQEWVDDPDLFSVLGYGGTNSYVEIDEAEALALLPKLAKSLKYSDDQARDDRGQWTEGGDGGGTDTATEARPATFSDGAPRGGPELRAWASDRIVNPDQVEGVRAALLRTRALTIDEATDKIGVGLSAFVVEDGGMYEVSDHQTFAELVLPAAAAPLRDLIGSGIIRVSGYGTEVGIELESRSVVTRAQVNAVSDLEAYLTDHGFNVEFTAASGLITDFIGSRDKARRTAERKAIQIATRVQHWKAFDMYARKWEGKFSDSARLAFEADRRAMQAIVAEVGKKARRRKASIDWTDTSEEFESYLQSAGVEGWRTAFVPSVVGLVTDQVNRWSVMLGMQFDSVNLSAMDWFLQYQLQFADPINRTTMDTVQELLVQGQLEGWSVERMSANLDLVFRQWMLGDLTPEDFLWFETRTPVFRRELIARTETVRASNAGTTAIYEDWGVEQHEWLAERDNRTRDSHWDADGQVVDIGEPFTVGDSQLLYPGDQSMGADLGEIANCRCTTIPVVRGTPGLEPRTQDEIDAMDVTTASSRRPAQKYSDDQARDDQGQWTDDGGSSGGGGGSESAPAP